MKNLISFVCILASLFVVSCSNPVQNVTAPESLTVVSQFGEDAQSAAVEYRASAFSSVPNVRVDVFINGVCKSFSSGASVSADHVEGVISYSPAMFGSKDSVVLIAKWNNSSQVIRLD